MSLAFFDFDNTLIHGDAGPLFGKHLHELRAADAGRIKLALRSTPFVVSMLAQAALYKVGAVRRSSIVRNAYKGLRGISVDLFEDEIDRFVDEEIPPRIYPAMVEEIETHHKEGRGCVILTTGMEALVKRTARHLPKGVEIIGCHLDTRNGLFTGKVTGPLYGADKANIMNAYTRAKGIKMEDCWAYTDHWSDKAMLEAVGHGVCVNPRGRLRDLAGERGWRVMDLDDPRK